MNAYKLEDAFGFTRKIPLTYVAMLKEQMLMAYLRKV